MHLNLRDPVKRRAAVVDVFKPGSRMSLQNRCTVTNTEVNSIVNNVQKHRTRNFVLAHKRLPARDKQKNHPVSANDFV